MTLCEIKHYFAIHSIYISNTNLDLKEFEVVSDMYHNQFRCRNVRTTFPLQHSSTKPVHPFTMGVPTHCELHLNKYKLFFDINVRKMEQR